MKSLVALTLLAALAAGAEAQDLSNYDKVLLPAWAQTPITGANGSTFRTVLEVQPQSRAVQFYPTVTTNLPVLPTFGVIPPQVANTLKLYDLVPRAHGRLLILEKGGADTLTFSYQVIALDADGTPRSTSLPVVRERDFRSGPRDIVGIPTWPVEGGYRHRNMLRVYDPDNTGTLRVKITWGLVNFNSSPTTEASHIVDVSGRDFDDPSYPYFAEVDLDTLIPPCVPGIPVSHPCAQMDRVIRVTPLAEGARFWAFVSTTDNITQAVTVHTPQ
jgi:hypothetical protein